MPDLDLMGYENHRCPKCSHTHVAPRVYNPHPPRQQRALSAEHEWLMGQAARYDYKPGATIRIDEDPGWEYRTMASRFTLDLGMKLLDSRGSGREIPIRSVGMVPPTLWERDWLDPLQRAAEFERFLRGALETLEIHELREWFRRDGELVDDPHKKP